MKRNKLLIDIEGEKMTKCKIFDIDCPHFDNPKKQCWYNKEHRCSATKGLKYVEKATESTESKKKRGLLWWFRK